MSDFSLEDATQLIGYYRQRVSDLEYQVLQLQLQLSKAAHTHDTSASDSPKEATKISKVK